MKTLRWVTGGCENLRDLHEVKVLKKNVGLSDLN